MIKASPCLQGHALYEKIVSHSLVSDSANPWTVAHQAPSICGISQARILEWVAISSPEDLSNSGTGPRSPALQADSLPSKSPVKPTNFSPLSVTVPLSWIFIIIETSLSSYLSETCIFTQHCFLAMPCWGFGIQRRCKNKSFYPQSPASYLWEKSSDSTMT